MPKSIIEVNNLVKRYKKADKNAVDDVSFKVEEGEFFSLLGPNGAGKTTTISILTTTLSKTSGEVKVAGYDTDKEAEKVRSKVGIIFQNPSLDANLSAEENVRFHAILYGLYPYRPSYALMPEAYKKHIYELAEIIGIEKVLHKPIKTFSGGMKRRLEIVRSLIHKPKVLFLDEPSSGLDPLSRKNLWKYLNEVRTTQNTTILLTTHYLEEAEDADRVAIINNGKLEMIGTPRSIKNELVEETMTVDAKDRKKLKKELDNMKLKYTGKGPFVIPLGKQRAQSIIQKLKTELSILDIDRPTLEDAYLQLIGGIHAEHTNEGN